MDYYFAESCWNIWISNHWISAGNQETRPLPWCWFGCLGHKVKFCIRRCLVYLHWNELLVADTGNGLWWAYGWLKLAKMRRLWVGAFAKSSLDVLPSWPTWMDSNVMVKKLWNRMTSNPVFRLGTTWQCPADQNAYIIYQLFWMSHFGWLNEFGPYISINPTESYHYTLAKVMQYCPQWWIQEFLHVLSGEFPQASKEGFRSFMIFSTQCAPSRQNRIHRILLSHWENFMTGLCLFWRWSRLEVLCMLAASIHNIKSIHCSHPVPLGAWTWKRGCQAMHLTKNASPSQKTVEIRCPLPWRSAATWFDMLSHSWCSVFCLTPLANQISC